MDKYTVEIEVRNGMAHVTVLASDRRVLSSGRGPKATVLQLVKGAAFILDLSINPQKKN